MGKNASNTSKNKDRITFRLVQASNADPRIESVPWQRALVRHVSQNNIWKNRTNKDIPKEFLSALNPLDFGIHDQLTQSQRDTFINEIYGSEDAYKSIVSNAPSIELKNGIKTQDLDGDCYFPKDGYDYEQHLAKINFEYFLPADRSKSLGVGDCDQKDTGRNVFSATDFPALHTNKELDADDNDEVREVLDALDSGNDEDFEDLEDDFVFKAMDDENPAESFDDSSILWGDYKYLNVCKIIPEGESEDINEFSNKEDMNECLNKEDIEGDMGKVDYCPVDPDMAGKKVVEQDLRYYKKDLSYDDSYKSCMNSMDPQGSVEQIRMLLERSSDSQSEFSDVLSQSSSEKWDVETVLTRYTNLTNHPKKIITIKKLPAVSKTKTPNKVTNRDVETVTLPEVVTVRNRGETSEEKKLRKSAVKEAKSIIIKIKRENKNALREARKLTSLKTSKGSYDITNGVKYLRL